MRIRSLLIVIQRWLIRLSLVFSGLVVASGLILATLTTIALHHPTLHNQLWPHLQHWTDGQLSVQNSSGTLWQGLTIQHINIHTTDIELQIDNLHWQWKLRDLLKGQLYIKTLHANRVLLHLNNNVQTEPTAPPNVSPFELLTRLNFGLRLDQLQLNDFLLQQPDTEPLQIHVINAAFSWRAQQLNIKHINMSHKDYSLTSKGQIKILDATAFSGQLDNQLKGLMQDDLLLNIGWHGSLQSLQLQTNLVAPLALNIEHQLTLQPNGINLNSTWSPSVTEFNADWTFAVLDGHSQLSWLGQHLRFDASLQTQLNQGPLSQHTVNLTLQDMADLQFDWQNVLAQAGSMRLNANVKLPTKTAAIQLETNALKLNSFVEFDGILDSKLRWSLTDLTNRQSALIIDSFTLQGLPQPLSTRGQLHTALHTPLHVETENDVEDKNKDTRLNVQLGPLNINYGDYQGDLTAQLLTNESLTTFRLPHAELLLGNNRIAFSGERTEQLHLQAKGDLLNLAQLWPRLAGVAQFNINLQGEHFSDAHTTIEFNTQQLRFDDISIGELKLDASVPLDTLAWTELELAISNLTVDGPAATNSTQPPPARFAFDQLNLKRHPHNSGLRTELEFKHPQLALRAQADEESPSFNNSKIALNWLEVDGVHSGHWLLTEPLILDWTSPDLISSNQACLDSRQHQQAKLCLQAFADKRLTWSIHAWPIFDWLAPFIPTDIDLDGLINGYGAFIWESNWQFQQQLNSAHLNANVRLQGYEWPVPLKDWQLGLTLGATELSLTTEAKLNDDGHIQARIKLIPNQAWSDADIDGQLSLALNSLPLSDDMQSLIKPHRSNLLIRSALSGQVNKIQHDTRANLDALFDLPLIGLTQQQITLQAQLNEALIQAHGLLKQANNQQAEIAFDLLNLQQQPTFKMTLTTDSIDLLNTPFARVKSGADVNVLFEQQKLTISGDLEIKDSMLNLDGVPLAQKTQLSNDEVIMDSQNKPVVDAEELQVGLDLKLRFADKVSVQARDIQAYLSGELHLKKALDNPDIAGFGQVSLRDGKLQLDARNRIEIDPSFFSFTGSLNNPTLNVNLSRQVLQTQARLNVTGTATQPQFVFYSTPHLSQGQIINLLIFGRAADLEHEPNYQSQLVSALYKLGIQNNTPLLNQLTETLGIEDVYFDIRDQQTSNLIVGRALTDKLYIRYAMGLGGQQNKAVQMFYQLAPNWFIESQSGDLSRSLDIIFRKEH